MNTITVGILSLLGVFQFVNGLDQLYVQHAPSYYEVSNAAKDGQSLKTTQFSYVVLASLGFSINKDFRWSGIKSSTFFKRPEAAIIVEFDGFENVDSEIAERGFPLTVNVDPSTAFAVIADGISSRYPRNKLLTLDVTTNDDFYTLVEEYPDILEGIDTDADKLTASQTGQYKLLNISNNDDREFLNEIRLFNDVVNALIAKIDKVQQYKAVDLIWMQSLAMKNLVKTYGANSTQVAEATAVIQDFLKSLEIRLSKMYDDNYLLLVLTTDFQSDVPLPRLGRSLLETVNASEAMKDLNVSPEYNEDYPAMFNIILFISLLLSLIVFAIALGMWHIDPGRDSIIYRMTSQRIKKDQ